MPYRDSEANRYTGKVRWRQGDIFDADDRAAVLALTGVAELTLEEARQVFTDEDPPADLAPRRRRGNGISFVPLSEASDGE